MGLKKLIGQLKQDLKKGFFLKIIQNIFRQNEKQTFITGGGGEF